MSHHPDILPLPTPGLLERFRAQFMVELSKARQDIFLRAYISRNSILDAREAAGVVLVALRNLNDDIDLGQFLQNHCASSVYEPLAEWSQELPKLRSKAWYYASVLAFVIEAATEPSTNANTFKRLLLDFQRRWLHAANPVPDVEQSPFPLIADPLHIDRHDAYVCYLKELNINLPKQYMSMLADIRARIVDHQLHDRHILRYDHEAVRIPHADWLKVVAWAEGKTSEEIAQLPEIEVESTQAVNQRLYGRKGKPGLLHLLGVVVKQQQT